jgi:phosphoribosyl 1,2-cyclic phosphate phosphodiesterase
LRVSILVEWDNFTYVVDCGPDFRYEMLRANCKKIDGILFTHEHSDHVLGLDDIRPFFYRHGDIPIYAHKRVLNAIRTRFAYFYETVNKYPGAPTVKEIEITNTPFYLNEMKIIPINVNHNFVQVFGFRFNDFVYITDAKTISKEEIDKLKGVKVLVINALKNESHHSHFSLREALAFIAEVQPEKAYLTHISHLLGFHDEVQQKLPNNVYLAYDNLEITI